ncbi:MAG: T9SS type A sorting domain-containing protein, partial [Bacteroidia bacterium]|nr:T9SS type A sorting domain-containing protein [Bacteroidia bacterium]
ATLNQILVGSYDPNDKTCLEGHLVNNSQIGEYLHYMIRFQNTGNYPADFVVIVDTLDNTKYDLQSLQIIETSHEAHIDLHGKVLQFYFENIQIADSFSNEPESHGFVVYKIRTKSSLPQNSSVSNKAEIYFDYNPPVVTNVATTTFTNTVGINPPVQQVFRCFPNPAQNTLTIESKVPQHLIILNSIGEVIREISVLDKQEVDISDLPEGMYFLKNENGGVSFVKK